MCEVSSRLPNIGQEQTRSIDLTFDAVIPYCLVYLTSQGRVLLIRKSKGRLHEGEWIGLGGKLEPGEDPVSSAVREFREESGLILSNPMLRGTFIWIDEVRCGIVHIVTATRWSGELSESEEGELRWHSVDDCQNWKGWPGTSRCSLTGCWWTMTSSTRGSRCTGTTRWSTIGLPLR